MGTLSSQDRPAVATPYSPRISVAIMAHPRRKDFIPYLLGSLDCEPTVVWDENNDRWDTGRRSMLAYNQGCTHHLVIQDDAIVCKDLVAGLTDALCHIPDPDGTPVCLYIGRNKPFRYSMAQAASRAERDRAAWVAMTQVHWGVGIMLPIGLIKPMIDYCDTRDEIGNYDRRISRWVERYQLPVYYTWPSLVDHRGVPSLVKGRASKGRYAHNFIGTNASALDQDWGKPVIHLPSLNRKKWLDPTKENARKRRIHRPSHKEWR